MYRVVKFFTDLQDNNHAYNTGDVFPRDGVDVSPERLEELSGCNNKQHAPLIEKVGKEKAEPVKKDIPMNEPVEQEQEAEKEEAPAKKSPARGRKKKG